VRDALAKVDGITDVECDTSTTTCTFKAPKDLDVDAKLNEIVDAGNKHVKGWSKK
jgi:copper chaperone CopZ